MPFVRFYWTRPVVTRKIELRRVSRWTGMVDPRIAWQQTAEHDSGATFSPWLSLQPDTYEVKTYERPRNVWILKETRRIPIPKLPNMQRFDITPRHRIAVSPTGSPLPGLRGIGSYYETPAT